MSHPAAGGAEIVSDQMCTRFAAEGHTVMMLTSRPAGAPEKSEYNGYTILRMGNRYDVYLKVAQYAKKHLLDWADQVIEEINTAPFYSQGYGFTKAKRTLVIYQLAREVWFYQFPPVLSLIGYLLEPLYLLPLGKNDVVTISESTRQDLIKHGFDGEKISLMSMGTNVVPLTTLEGTKKQEKPTLFAIGTARPMKRGLDQLKAFALAKEKIPDFQFVLGGSLTNPYGEEMLKWIEQSGIADSIHLVGRISDQEKEAWMAKAHLVTMTSVKEGWGLVVTEANSQGTPAVVYDVDGLRDSTRDGETGWVVAPNPQALADGFVEALTNTEEYEKRRLAAWEWSKSITFEQGYADVCSRTINASK